MPTAQNEVLFTMHNQLKPKGGAQEQAVLSLLCSISHLPLIAVLLVFNKATHLAEAFLNIL